MIVSIRTYLNYLSIKEAIVVVRNDVEKVQEEIFYVDKFLISYLSSSYADYFLAHENNVPLPRETIIRFASLEEKSGAVAATGIDLTPQNTLSSPKKSWKHFLSEKFRGVW